MKLHYDATTDSLYIDFTQKPGSDAREVAPGIVIDFDEAGSVVGIDIQHASKIIDLQRLDTESVPFLPQREDDTESRVDAGSK